MVKKADIPRHVVAVALELAATQGWRDTTLADIAAAAKLPLAKIHAHFGSKTAIVSAFIEQIDAEVLAGEDPELADQPPRDRLFDVMMRRFDALKPHKAAVRAIVCDTLCNPQAAVCGGLALARSMTWMLEAAGIGATGLRGVARVKGLAAIHLSVLRVWFDDDSEDMARTMAVLDRRLRQAESLVMLCRLPRPRPAAPEAEPT